MSARCVHTFCRICEPHCGLVAHVEGGRLVSLRPDRDHPVHKGFSCNKGIQYIEIHNDPDRLFVPLKRRNPKTEIPGRFEPIGMDQALREVGEKLAEIQTRYGNDALAIYSGNPVAFSASYGTNGGRLLGGFATRTLFTPSTQDCANKFVGSEAMFGAWFVHPIPDLVHTHYFLSIGCNPAVSHMSIIHVSDPMQKLKDIKRRGGKVVFVNPRKIESSTPETGEVLLIKPDSDVYFLAALLHEIAFEIGFERVEVERRGRNVQELLAFVRNYPPARVEHVTGISAVRIREVAREFCEAPSASIHMSTGVNMGRQGALSYLLVNMISLFSGNMGRRGGNIYQTGFANTAGDSKRLTEQPYFDTPFGEMRLGGSSLPGNLMSEIFRAGHLSRTPVRAMLVVGGNPLLAVSGEQRLREAFAGLELIVAIDLYRNATGELADYLFPATDALEREDIYFLGPGLHVEPYVQYTPAVVAPTGERREEWWILSRILQEMGRPSMLDDATPEPLGAINARLGESELSIEKLKQLPCQTAVLPEANPGDIFDMAVQNEDGLIDCCPEIFRRGFASVEEQLHERLQEPEEQLKLITRRTGLMINSWMNNIARLKKGVHQSNPLWMNPRDAHTRGLHYGQKVRVRSDYGSIETTVAFDESLRLGVVSMSHGWGNQQSHGLHTASSHPGSNVNRLSPVGEGTFDILSSMSHLTGFNVNVEHV